MIKLELTTGKTLCLNLSDKDRELLLYNTWWSMSDSQRYMDKQIKITTEAGEYLYKVREIKNCQIVEDVPVTDKDATSIKVTPEKVTKKEDTLEDILKEFFPGEGILKETIRESFRLSFSNIPIITLREVLTFSSKIRELGIKFNPMDIELHYIIQEILNNPGSDITKYVERYQKHINNQNL